MSSLAGMLLEPLLGPLGRLLVLLHLEVQLRDGLGALVDLLGRQEAGVQHALEHGRSFAELLLLDQHVAEELVDLVSLERRLLLRRLGLLDRGERSVPLLGLHRLLRFLQRLCDRLGRHLVGSRFGSLCTRGDESCCRHGAHGKRQRQGDTSCYGHDDSCYDVKVQIRQALKLTTHPHCSIRGSLLQSRAERGRHVSYRPSA